MSLNNAFLKAHIEDLVERQMLSQTAHDAVIQGLLNYVAHRGDPDWETDDFPENMTRWLEKERLIPDHSGPSFFKSWLEDVIKDELTKFVQD